MDLKAFYTKLILIINFYKLIFAIKSNVTLEDLGSCKELRLAPGYSYQKFFGVESLKNIRRNEEVLRFTFYVIAAMDAHILLTETTKPNKNTKVYEIVLGAGKNTFSIIRRKMGTDRISLKNEKNILMQHGPTTIIVHQTTDGTIEVNIPGHDEPYMTYTDPNPLHIKYVSFSSFDGTSARWFYDCDSEDDQIEEQKRVLTTREKLQNDIFGNYSSYYPPGELRNINISFSITGISYSRTRSTLSTRVELELSWMDKRLVWEPSKYENITGIPATDFNYWTPSLMILNGAGESYPEFSPSYSGFISNTGYVRVYSKASDIMTWCTETASGWPDDKLECSVRFGVHGYQLTLNYPQTSRMLLSNELTELSEWHLQEVHISSVHKDNVLDLEMDDYYIPTTDLIVSLHMGRNHYFFKKVFYAPLLVAGLFILLSFGLKGFYRGLLNLLALLMLSIAFGILAKHSPRTYVSHLMASYRAYFIISCFTFIIHVIIRWLTQYPPKIVPPSWLGSIINSSIVRAPLGLNFTDAAEYLQIQEHPWSDCAKIINRLMLVATFIPIIVYYALS